MTEGWGNLSGPGNQQVYINVYREGQDIPANFTRYRIQVVYKGNNYGSWTNAAQYWSASTSLGHGWSGAFTIPYESRFGDIWLLNTIFDVYADGNGYGPGFSSSAAIDTNHGSIGDGSVGVGEGAPPRIPKVPGAPTPLGVDQIGADSMRYRFQGNDDGGTPIREWQIGYGTDPNNVQHTVGSGGTSTIGGLSNHTTWYFWSRGRNDRGWGPWSSRSQGTTLGHPSAPQSLSATPSTTSTGRIALSWAAPSTTGAGGITGYNVFRNGSLIATTTGTGTSYTDTGRTPYTSYSYTVAARNAYSNSVAGTGPASGSTSATAPGPPSEPRNVTAVADGGVAGRVNLSWTAPAQTGAGGITGYRIYFAGGSLIANQNGTGTTRTVDGLTPGTTYSFQIFARNALSDAEGSMSDGSNTPVVTPIGEPGAPTNLTVTTSPTVSNRLNLSWTAPPGTLSGFSIFRRDGSTDTLLAQVGTQHTSFQVDNLAAGTTYSFVVRARTVYTDTLSSGYPGNWGGPESNVASGVPSNNSVQTVPTLSAVTSGTNAVFNGTYTLTAVSSNTMSYAKGNADIASVASGGTVANSTNAVFNGSYPIASIPEVNKLTYAKSNADIPLLNVFTGSVTDTTNQSMNVTNAQVTAVNSGAHTLTYTKTGSNVASVAVPYNNPPGGRSLVTNLTNAIFNVSGKTITAVTSTTFSFAQIGTNVTENNAAGVATNTTNRDVYNGIKTVLSTPTSDRLTYTVDPNSEIGGTRTWFDPRGTVERTLSLSKLEVRYRSGWIG